MEPAAQSLLPPHPLQRNTSAEIGTVLLEKYEIGHLLGRGSFAKVHYGRSVENGGAVAIKIIDKKKTVAGGMEPTILSEISAMRRLHHHPNVLKIHEVMATKSKIYLVMELAVGGDLFSKLLRQGGRLPERAARRYFQQLASALSFCHRHGVAHRDVKPQNLLLDREGNLKVSDFGLSALPEKIKNGLLQTPCGTPAYTAPEVVARRGYDGAKADAWSCGVILFVLLAGYLPFDDSNLITMYRKIHRREYKFPDWIPKPTRSIIRKLLDPNPETRFSLEAVMETQWFKRYQENSKSVNDNQNNILDSLNYSAEKEKKSESQWINAFDIIALSSGLDLSGFFETTKMKENRFTARVSAGELVGRVGEIGGKLGYGVEKIKGGGTVAALRKEVAVVVVEAVDIAVRGAEAAVVVEVKVVDGELGEDQWEELMQGFHEIVLS